MLPEDIYSVEQVRELDRIAIEEHGIAGYELMQRAASATFDMLLRRWPETQYIRVYCGMGNNGGDGYVIARLAIESGLQADVITLGNHQNLAGDALKAREDWLTLNQSTFSLKQVSGEHSEERWADLVVDAIFGTGLTRPASGEWLSAIKEINRSGVPVVSVDVPSGLQADTGMPLGEAVRADLTVTYIGMKQGLLTGCAGDYTGQLEFDALAVPQSVYQALIPTAKRVSQQQLPSALPTRKRSTHKGNCGHALIIGGATGMQGAAQMAAEACARTGAGLVTLATQQGVSARDEIMSCTTYPIGNDSIQAALQKSTVLGIGPGLGQDLSSHELLDWLISSLITQGKNIVIDADGLNLLAKHPHKYQHWILTPHPGEAARLLNRTTSEVQAARVKVVRAIQKKYGGVCVLKGFGTLIDDGRQLSICTAGNPGMATGGMGDVLTGIITGLLAQGLGCYMAARIGVYIHAKAADLAVINEGERGLLASDLFPYIRQLVNPELSPTRMREHHH